ncbi:MAG TPA: hypothetical protein VJ248_01250 [Candidatus Udaeobacter sp.]|jgi:hypothetical protein|nr:hypothetical protein [Candidatus Udaeobacter sp.]
MTVKEQKRPWYGQHGVNGPRAYGKIIRKGQAALKVKFAGKDTVYTWTRIK